ncbi:hypothetical protein BGZ73_007144 [Actinomortierella ambigua]|nr:hypothetical protein BGZ73_007144 [Actinomortierella ambigua]
MRLSQVLLVLASTTVAIAQRSALYGGTYLGVELPDPKATPLEVYENPKNHVAAAASILIYAASEVEFTPSSSTPGELVKNLDEFESKASTFPGFGTADLHTSVLPLRNGGQENLEDVLEESIPSSDSFQIALELTSLLPARVKSAQDAVELNGRVALGLVAIDKVRHKPLVTVKLVRVVLDLQVDEESRKITIPAQARVELKYQELLVNAEFLVTHGQRLAATVKTYPLGQFNEFFHSKSAAKSIAAIGDWSEAQEHQQIRL